MPKIVVPTLTLEGAVARFRAAGIKTSETKIAAGIEQGAYPFGFCINIDGKRNFEIYAKQVDAYLAERAVGEEAQPCAT